MAATNPFRVSDLIAKYGWKVMPYLSNLGPLLLAEAQVLFVDSGHTNKLDADDTEHGHSFEKPLATIDYAIDLCTAAERSVILVAPGHEESLDASTIDFDVSDITIIGIGEGSNMPTIVFDSTGALVIIGANNIHLINLRFMPSAEEIVIGVDIETGKTGTIFERCVWAEGEGAADEFILGLDIKAGCTDTKVTNCLFRTKYNAAEATHAIKLTGASDNVIIEKSRFIGNWSTAAIGGSTTLSTDVLIDDITIKTADNAPGISMVSGTTGIIRNVCIEATDEAVNDMIVADTMAWFNNYGVTVDGAAAELIGGGEVNAQIVAHHLDHLIGLADGDAVRPASVVEDSILAKLMGSDDPATIGSYDNSKHSLEAIGDDADTIIEDITAAVPNTPTGASLQDILSKLDGENAFDNTTDSLEAISDKIQNRQDAAGGGITYFVDGDGGNDTYDGLTWATAFKTIDEAIGSVDGHVLDYDTVYVRGTDTFTETVSTGTAVGVKLIGVGDGKINPLWTSEAVGESALTINGQNWEVRNFLFHAGGEAKTAPMISVEETGASVGSGSVIENCYFHGGDTSNQAVYYGGGSIQNKLLNNHITAFGGSCAGEEAAVCGGSYVQSWCDGEVRGNVFTNNTKHLRLQSGNSVFKDNVFESQGSATSATTIINLVSSGVSVGYNTVVGNTFGDNMDDLTTGNGYYFSTTDLIAGNFCPNGLQGTSPTARFIVGTGQHSPFSRINHAFGTVYYVDKATGSDSYDGLSPAQPKLTIGGAIAASNLTVGSYNQNAIYVLASTYTEDLTTYPKNCDVIAIGSKCRITGNHSDAEQNVHWHNFEFRPGADEAAVYTAEAASHGTEFHHCRFKNTSNKATIAIDIETGADGVIDHCWIGGNNLIATGIRFNPTEAGGNQNWRVTNNYICVSDVGIQMTNGNAGYQNLIKDNHITAQSPTSAGTQLLVGIYDSCENGHCGFDIVNNTISAVDAIKFFTEDATYTNFSCTGNMINEAGVVAYETALA